jgi:RHS repeat-associated protein
VRNTNGSDSSACLDLSSSPTPRGYTDQEHLPGVCAINYNARIYNPTLGRMMSADPIVADPFSTQGFNRYAYVGNNPLNATDPTGMMEAPPENTLWPGKKGGGSPWGKLDIRGGTWDTGGGMFGGINVDNRYADNAPSNTSPRPKTPPVQTNAALPMGGTRHAGGHAPSLLRSGPCQYQTDTCAKTKFDTGNWTGDIIAYALSKQRFQDNVKAERLAAAQHAQGKTAPNGATSFIYVDENGVENTGVNLHLASKDGAFETNPWALAANADVAGNPYRLGTSEFRTHMETMRPFVESAVGVIAAATSSAAWKRGLEFVFGKNFRIAPFGNRTGHPTGELPHYHRRGLDPDGNVRPGQGIGRHRPWDTRTDDKSFWDRF